MKCDETGIGRPRKDGGWRWINSKGEQYQCEQSAAWKVTRASFVNVCGDLMPGSTSHYCEEHMRETWHVEQELTVEPVQPEGQASLFEVSA